MSGQDIPFFDLTPLLIKWWKMNDHLTHSLSIIKISRLGNHKIRGGLYLVLEKIKVEPRGFYIYLHLLSVIKKAKTKPIMPMETSTLIDVQSYVNQWNRCEVMDLERHFNFFDKDDSQYKRANFLYLEKDSIEQLFANDFVALEIKMGLATATPSEEIMSFAPIITWEDTDNKEGSCGFSFNEKSDELALTGAEQVGNNFLSTLSQNWLNCAPHYFGGLFSARVDNHSGRNVSSVLRLQSFKINKRANSALFEFLKDLQNKNSIPKSFYFYLGLDYNKFNKADEYSFSPILGFVMGGEVTHVMHPNFKTYLNAENEQIVNYEYISPCPPTCER